MDALDDGIVGLYLLAVCGVGVYTHLKHRKSARAGHEAAPWWAVATSYFASNIGSDAIIGLSSAGATVGMSASWFDFASALAFVVLAYGFLPAYRRSGIFTLPEYMERRFSKGIRAYLAVIALVMYIISKTAVTLYCGAIVIELVARINAYIAITLLLVMTTIITLVGGLHAVINIEVVNSVLLVVTGAVASIIATHRVGGWKGLTDMVAAQTSDVQRAGVSPDMVHLHQTSGPYAFTALVLGSPVMILWFHCCDQEMAQRGLASASNADSKLGAVAGGFLKLTVPWTWCLPGLVVRLLLPDELGCTPYAPAVACTEANNAYPLLMTRILPVGVRGFMTAAALAGVFSVLASTFNSASTLFAMDFYARFRGRERESELVWAGRGFVAVMALLAVAWLPLLSHLTPSLYTTMQSLNALFSPPILVVFLAALLWPRATQAGAWVSLVAGHVLGATRLILTVIPSTVWSMTESYALQMLVNCNYLYFAACSFLFSATLLIFISCFTAAQPIEQVAPLTAHLPLRMWYAVHKRVRTLLGQPWSVEWHAAMTRLESHPVCAQCNAPLDPLPAARTRVDDIVINLPRTRSSSAESAALQPLHTCESARPAARSPPHVNFAVTGSEHDKELDVAHLMEERRFLRSETLSPVHDALDMPAPPSETERIEKPSMPLLHAGSAQAASSESACSPRNALYTEAKPAGAATLTTKRATAAPDATTSTPEEYAAIDLRSPIIPDTHASSGRGAPATSRGVHGRNLEHTPASTWYAVLTPVPHPEHLCKQCQPCAQGFANMERLAALAALLLVGATVASMAAIW